MSGDDARLRKLLLVRVVEEEQADRFSGADQAAAAVSALGGTSDREILLRRAGHLVSCLPERLAAIAGLGPLPRGLYVAGFVLSVLTAFAANYLGPSAQFHIVYNPVSLLLIWNLLSYGLLIGLGLVRAPRRAPAAARDVEREQTEPPETTPPPWWVVMLLGGIWRRYLALRSSVRETRAELRGNRIILQRYVLLYADAAGGLLRAEFRLLMHVCAIGLALGAIAGLYWRGLFVEYQAIWRSTFVSDPATIRLFINALLAPALLLIDGGLTSLAQVAELVSAAGAPASRWLHRLALMAVLLVLVPRGLLAWRARVVAKRERLTMRADLNAPYFDKVLVELRTRHLGQIREATTTEVRAEIELFSDRIAAIVQDELFDARIAPRLRTFREQGGRVDELEAEIRDLADDFEPLLEAQLVHEQHRFSEGLQIRLAALIGRHLETAGHRQVQASELAPAGELSGKLGGQVAGELTGAIGVVVTTAVSATVGGLSGGLGKSIGIAVISHLLGTSGPVGLLIGAVIGVAGGGAMYLMGRKRLKDSIRSWRIPAAAARLALRSGKLEAARVELIDAVRAQVRQELEPTVEAITDQLLAALPADVVGEGQAASA